MEARWRLMSLTERSARKKRKWGKRKEELRMFLIRIALPIV